MELSEVQYNSMRMTTVYNTWLSSIPKDIFSGSLFFKAERLTKNRMITPTSEIITNMRMTITTTAAITPLDAPDPLSSSGVEAAWSRYVSIHVKGKKDVDMTLCIETKLEEVAFCCLPGFYV